MVNSARRAKGSLALVSLAGLLHCGDPQPSSQATAVLEQQASAALPPGSASALAVATGQPAPSAAESAAPLAEASASASVPFVADAATPSSAKVDLPDAKNGILAPGTADKLMAVGSPLRVVLLDAGSEPREVMVYEFTDQQKQKVLLGLDMTMTMAAPGMPAQAMTLPRMQMAFDFASSPKDANNRVKVNGTIADFSLIPSEPQHKQMIAKMQAPLALMKGMTVSYAVDPRGQASDVKVNLPPNAPPEAAQMMDQMKQSLDVMASPLPAEPVGLGAKWQIVQRVSNPADILQMSTVTLKKRDGKNLELMTEIRQFAASSKISSPGMPPGTTAELTNFESSGTSTMFIDLARVAPNKGQGDMRAKMGLTAGPQKVTMDMGVKMTLQSK